MLYHRKGHHKPDSALIGRFQKLCGKSFFHGNDDKDKPTTLFSEPNMNGPWEGIRKGTEHSSMDLEYTGSLNGEVPPTLFTLSESLPWVLPQSDDFGLFSSRSGIDTTLHSQSTAELSPKTRFQTEIRPSGAQTDSEYFKQTEPAQFRNSIDHFAPALNGFSPLSHLTHRNSGYEEMDESPNSCIKQPPVRQTQADSQTVSPDALLANQKTTPRPELDQFRFRTVLKAPTAMVGAPGAVPESYLNKGNIYKLQVRDSTPPSPSAETIQYRTFIRISFDGEERRSNPTAYWKLWNENRESKTQSHQQKAMALEYAGRDHAQMQIEQVSLDGFCVTWTSHPDANVHACSIPVQFNFLSTDFTRSKGVKGISVRLCSKTEQVSPAETAREPEICFCKVKLFRDHGAERKQSNDVTSIRKKMERLEQQFNEPPAPELSIKRRKSDMQGARAFRYSKQALKRQDVWPPNVNNPSQMEFQDHIRSKIDTLQRELESTCSESYLCLRGDSTDDPDLYPIFSLDETASQKRISTGSASSYGASPRSDSMSSHGSSPEHTVESLPDFIRPGRSTISSPRDNQYHRGTPVACFFTLLSSHEPSSDQHYRAIYLAGRTVHELVEKISEKYLLKPTRILRVLYIKQSGLEVLVDDDFVREMAESQAMGVEIVSLPDPGLTASDAVCEIRLTY